MKIGNPPKSLARKKKSSCYFKRLYLLINLHYAVVQRDVKSAHCRLHSAPHKAFNWVSNICCEEQQLKPSRKLGEYYHTKGPFEIPLHKKTPKFKPSSLPSYGPAVSVRCVSSNIKSLCIMYTLCNSYVNINCL
jgi:hypothetical protein